jgi:hypothetical protein
MKVMQRAMRRREGGREKGRKGRVERDGDDEDGHGRVFVSLWFGSSSMI